MLAIIHTAYGPPNELQLQDVPKPVPKDDEVLVKVCAATVSTSDCNMRNMTFVPGMFRLPMRLQFGLTVPRIRILGFDFAGLVEATGKDAATFQAGDRVFGTTEPAGGAHAEYVCVPASGVLALKPATISHEEAAAVPVAANTALHFLRELGNVQPGQAVLINGASGAIGTFAVQLARHFDAEVTAICSSRNVELVKSLGADHVIDYTQEDFTQSGQQYDVIFDAVGKSSFAACKPALKERGIYLTTVPTASALWQAQRTKRGTGKRVKVEGAPATVENLHYLRELLEAGKLRSVIDRTYPLAETAEAFRYVEAGRKRGNVVIVVAQGGGNL